MDEDFDYIEDYEFSDVWKDVTDQKHSHIRKKYFHVFINYKRAQIVNIFSAYLDPITEELSTFHVIEQNSFINVTGEYKLLTVSEILQTYNIDVNPIVKQLINELK